MKAKIPTVTVYLPGQQVLIAGGVRAIILATHITGSELQVTYHVCWWLNTERTEATISPLEIDHDQTLKQLYVFDRSKHAEGS